MTFESASTKPSPPDSSHSDEAVVSEFVVSTSPTNRLNLPDLKTFFFAISSVVLVWLPVLVLKLGMVMFSGMVVYALTRGIANWIRRHVVAPKQQLAERLKLDQRAEWVAILILVLLTSIGIYLFGDWVAEKASVDRFNSLLAQIMLVIDQLHKLLPDSVSQHLPESVSSIKRIFAQTIKDYAPQLQVAGIHTLKGFGYGIIGAVIGGIIAIQVPAHPHLHTKPLTRHFRQKFDELMAGFTDVFFAQVKISSINTILTAIYLLGILPLFGHPLPMAWTVVLITFIAGLLPVIGNLISNTIIVSLSLTHGLGVSISSLAWLVTIHKLEYFLNAQIIGSKIRSTAWELLLFMLVLEATFSLSGLLAAPIIYAQIKRILTDRGWV